YGRYSANPIGRLVLYLFGYHDERRQGLSDRICSGLQLTNFWQDVAIDLDKGRIYFPRRDMERFEVTVSDLGRRAASSEFIELMRHEIALARRMLIDGAELSKLVDFRLSRDVLMFAGGGLALLRAIERAGCDVFDKRPKLSKLDYLKLGWKALSGNVEI
ncbi:MAG TPA: squalene/phytoene synthase family protein, partial [Candidatus Binataceae bacterium]